MTSLADTIAATLAEHSYWNCVFNDCIEDGATAEQHEAHQADILAADFTARLNAERARNGQVPPEGWLS